MTVRNLDLMFAPQCVALVGASPEPGTVGSTLVRNLTTGGFTGQIFLVNPKYAEIGGYPCYPNIAALPSIPTLAVIVTPPAVVPKIIAELGQKGTRAAVIITAGLGDKKQACLDAARPYCLRILGPNVLGLMLPNLGLNASFAHREAPKGDLAFLSQSGALVTAVVDWAASRNIGFSHVVSLGDMADIDFGDLLDYLAGDIKSRAILIYMESLTHAAKFISAARRAARSKPVIVVKSGRHQASAQAAMSHTGALAGSDAAYEAAFRRTGLLRVDTLPELFAAAGMLSRTSTLSGERLMILTNGGGAGVLATDELLTAGGKLAALSEQSRIALDAALPATWSKANPVDIIGDAGPERYRASLSQLLRSPGSDAVLVLQCPTALAPSTENARAVIGASKAATDGGQSHKALLTCWLGDEAVREARELFAAYQIPTFETPSDAVSGFMQLVRHTRAQAELAVTPPAGPAADPCMRSVAGTIIEASLKAGRSNLTSAEAKAILQSAGIPVAETVVASDPDEVRRHAARILVAHQAVVVKILSRDISHKSDVGGVRLNIESAAAAQLAAKEILDRACQLRPDARIDGLMVEPMIKRPDAHEVIIGMSEDKTFGPMLLFGAGGIAVEVIADTALALPPLDLLLARQLIQQTRIARLLAGYRDRPPVDIDALARALVRVSQLIIEVPEIRELDINPLLVDQNGLIALDARVRIADALLSPRMALAIRPYPSAWETKFDLPGLGTIVVRPVRPEDEALYHSFFAKVSLSDVRLRFFSPKANLSHKFLARLTQIDYAREMAFVAVSQKTNELVGVVRLILDPDLTRGEYAILVRSDLKGHGLGWKLMSHLIAYAKSEGVSAINGTVLAENTTMLDMARKVGFKVKAVEGDASILDVELMLKPSSPDQRAPSTAPH